MEMILSGLETLLKSIVFGDPGVVAALVIDNEGTDLTKIVKSRFKAALEKGATTKLLVANRPKEENDPLSPVINAIMKYGDQFLKFLRPTGSKQSNLLSWYFENLVVYAVYSPYGSIAVYCERDVNEGYVKEMLRQAIPQYNQIMEPVFQ